MDVLQCTIGCFKNPAKFSTNNEDSMPATLPLPLSAHELQEAMRNARPIDAARWIACCASTQATV